MVCFALYMKATLLPLAFVIAVVHHTAFAQLPAGSGSAPEDLSAARQRQTAARDALSMQAAESQAALQKWYFSVLDALKKDAVGKGDLDGVLVIEKERERAVRDLTQEEKNQLPKLLRPVRDQYDQGRAQRVADHKAKLAASLRAYLVMLEALEKALTQKSNIGGAVEVRKERAAVAEQLNALQPWLAPAGVPPAPPTGQPAATVAATPSAATNPPAGKPPTGLGGTPKAMRVEVAAVLGVADVTLKQAPEAISFRTPPSPTTSGGKGLLLKNDPALGRRETTWTCFMVITAPHDGIQFIHPLGTGHVIVHLRENGLFLVAPDEMAKTPWVGGDAKKIRLASGAEKMFPLTRGYIVTSQLSGSGKYTISLDGKVVGRASLDPGPALTLTSEYKGERLPAGEEFPLNWSPGYAAFIAGGRGKGGALQIRDLVFQAGASNVAP